MLNKKKCLYVKSREKCPRKAIYYIIMYFMQCNGDYNFCLISTIDYSRFKYYSNLLVICGMTIRVVKFFVKSSELKKLSYSKNNNNMYLCMCFSFHSLNINIFYLIRKLFLGFRLYEPSSGIDTPLHFLWVKTKCVIFIIYVSYINKWIKVLLLCRSVNIRNLLLA